MQSIVISNNFCTYIYVWSQLYVDIYLILDHQICQKYAIQRVLEICQKNCNHGCKFVFVNIFFQLFYLFAECHSCGTRQTFILCRVPWSRHSANLPPLLLIAVAPNFFLLRANSALGKGCYTVVQSNLVAMAPIRRLVVDQVDQSTLVGPSRRYSRPIYSRTYMYMYMYLYTIQQAGTPQ